jgi:hypothetical protein
LRYGPRAEFFYERKPVARIRTIKPEFFTSEDIVGLSAFARLLYIALWCEADREGRLSWRTGTYKLRYFPADRVDIEALCMELVERGLIVLYGDRFAHIPTFLAHQHVNPREAASVLPAPPVHDASSRVTDAQGGREGKEGKGKEDASSRVAPSALPAWLPQEAWKAWLEVRRRIGAPNTEFALNLSIRKLARLRAEGQDPRAVLEQSIERGWRGLFPVKRDDGTVAPVMSSVARMCAYCGNPASGGMTSGIWHCHEHFDDAMAQKPRPKVAA